MATVAQYDITKLSLQQIFDLATEHLIEQKVPSTEPSGDCSYSSKGLTCAAGPFLPFYHKDMEGTSWRGLRGEGFFGEEKKVLDYTPFKDLKVSKEVDDLIFELQKVHDTSSFFPPETYLKEILAGLKELAKHHNLTFQGE